MAPGSGGLRIAATRPLASHICTAEGAGEVDLPDGIQGRSLHAAHPSGFRHFQAIEGFAVDQRAVGGDLKAPTEARLRIGDDEHRLIG